MNIRGAIVYVCRVRGCQSELVLRRDDHLPNPAEWMCPSCEDALLEQQMNALEHGVSRVNFPTAWPRPINMNYVEPSRTLTHKKAGA